jgi:hypothetical protein
MRPVLALLLLPFLVAPARADPLEPIALRAAECASALYNAPESAVLRSHLSLNPAEPTRSELSDKSFPTDVELAALDRFYSNLTAVCRKDYIDETTGLLPTIAALASQEAKEADENVAMLNRRKLTWGEFTRRRRDIAIKTGRRMTAELSRLVGAQTPLQAPPGRRFRERVEHEWQQCLHEYYGYCTNGAIFPTWCSEWVCR